MRQSNIIRFIFVILLFTMNSQIITYSREANNNTLNISNKITLTPNLNLNINETSNSKLFSIFINTNTILQTQYTYITLETIGQYYSYSYLGITLNITLGTSSQIQYINSYDFDSHFYYYHIYIFKFENIKIIPNEILYINLTLDKSTVNNFYFNGNILDLFVKSINIYAIDTPVIDPVIIPAMEHGYSPDYLGLQINLLGSPDSIQGIIFLPPQNDINLTISTTALIKIAKISITNAQWVNLPNLTLANNHFVFSFVSDGFNDSRIFEINYFPQEAGKELVFNISGSVVLLQTITPIPTISRNDYLILFVSTAIIIAVPCIICFRQRRRKISKILNL